jgi:glucose/arabinose dehydrogenase
MAHCTHRSTHQTRPGARWISPAIVGLLLASAPAVAQNAPQYGIAPAPLSSTPYLFDTAEQHGIKVSLLTKALARPFALQFLPDGDLLVAERGGNLRIIRKATKDAATLAPEPISGMPRTNPAGANLGLYDLALHPDFARNNWLYFTFLDPVPNAAGVDGPPRNARLKLMRATLKNGQLSNIVTLFDAPPAPPTGSRIEFGKDGTLWMSTSGPYGLASQDLTSPYGKILRFNADGTTPQDNPFVGKDVDGPKGKQKAHPAIYSYGHRDQHGLTVHPVTGQVFSAEHGPNGGDEVNLIKPGANYGWPDYSHGRNYDGKELTALPLASGIEKPLVVWLPSIAPSGLLFYQGDGFPAWKGNLFIGSARRGEINGTGGLERVVLNAELGELRRETLLTQLGKRVRDVAQGPDGNIYVLTDGDEHAVLRIEPTPIDAAGA